MSGYDEENVSWTGPFGVCRCNRQYTSVAHLRPFGADQLITAPTALQLNHKQNDYNKSLPALSGSEARVGKVG